MSQDKETGSIWELEDKEDYQPYDIDGERAASYNQALHDVATKKIEKRIKKLEDIHERCHFMKYSENITDKEKQGFITAESCALGGIKELKSLIARPSKEE